MPDNSGWVTRQDVDGVIWFSADVESENKRWFRWVNDGSDIDGQSVRQFGTPVWPET